MASRQLGLLASLLCAVALLGSSVSGGITRETICGDDLLRLECRSRSIVAIHEAYVTTDLIEGNLTCPQNSANEEEIVSGLREVEDRECREDLRVVINRKCSGMKRCNYRYGAEVAKKCDSKRSVVVVLYDCVRESSIYKYCNTRLRLKEGYIASPGYPLFYPHLKECRWYIDAEDGHVVVVRPLHVHLRPPTVIHHDEEYPLRAGLHPDIIRCDVDYMRVEEAGTKKSEVCGENLAGLSAVEGQASKGVSIRFISKQFFPASGFLIYFKVKGCATVAPPDDVFRVWRNGTDALYRCLDGRVFNDTNSNSRVLRCVGEHRWNDSVNVPCVDVDVVQLIDLNRSTNYGRKEDLENMTNDQASGPPVSLKRTSYVEDIIVPSVLMALLIIGNTIIIVIIFTIRRRHELAREQREIEEVCAKEEKEDDEQKTKHKTTSV